MLEALIAAILVAAGAVYLALAGRAQKKALEAEASGLREHFRPIVDAEAELGRIIARQKEAERAAADETARSAQQRDATIAEIRKQKELGEQEMALARKLADAQLAEVELARNDHERVIRLRDEEWALKAHDREKAWETSTREKTDRWQAEFSAATLELAQLQDEIDGANEAKEIQDFGLFKPRFDFATAAAFKERLEIVRDAQKQHLKAKTAAVCPKEWTVDGSKVEGRKMTDRTLKLMLRAFNGECDAMVASVTWKNVMALRERLKKSFEAINALGETQTCSITKPYLALKIEELDLAFEHAEKVNAEKEEQREIREKMREEEKALKLIEKEKAEAESEEAKYRKALEKAEAAAREAVAEQSAANEKERAELDAKIAKLHEMLATAEDRKQRAISQAELTKRGHVYVLSNEGSFGANVFKVGLTRRLDPLDRVDELGDASVPFAFDVHAIIRSDDAPNLEMKLHEALEPHRVNLVNRRKEFFRTPLEKIVDLVHRHHGTIDFTLMGEAAEYRKTLAIRAEREAMVVGHEANKSATNRAEEIRARLQGIQKAG